MFEARAGEVAYVGTLVMQANCEYFFFRSLVMDPEHAIAALASEDDTGIATNVVIREMDAAQPSRVGGRRLFVGTPLEHQAMRNQGCI